jgi:hypothetical protein
MITEQQKKELLLKMLNASYHGNSKGRIVSDSLNDWHPSTLKEMKQVLESVLAELPLMPEPIAFEDRTPGLNEKIMAYDRRKGNWLYLGEFVNYAQYMITHYPEYTHWLPQSVLPQPKQKTAMELWEEKKKHAVDAAQQAWRKTNRTAVSVMEDLFDAACPPPEE